MDTKVYPSNSEKSNVNSANYQDLFTESTGVLHDVKR